MNPVVTSNFRVDELKKYALGPGVEIKLSSVLPGVDASPDAWRTSAIGNIVIIVNDPDVALQLQIHLGKPVKMTLEIVDPLIEVIKPDSLRSGMEQRPIHRIETTGLMSPGETETKPLDSQAQAGVS
jgi:hypothetical protein